MGSYSGRAGLCLNVQSVLRSCRPAALLDNSGDHVEQLRTHTGFLNQGGWFEGGQLFLDWLKRWPAHLLLDDVRRVASRCTVG